MERGTSSAISSAGVAIIALTLALAAVSVVYVTSTQGSADQISSLNQQLSQVRSQVQQLARGQTDINASLAGLAKTLPLVNQKPTTRVETMEWSKLLSQQDRFYTAFVVVNQGDLVDITFISNDTASHTFTIDQPYDFQINGSIPGTIDDPTGKVFTTQPTNNSPGVIVSGSPGNVTGHGSFVAKYAGIFEYYCIYHIHLGMFGYLVVLPNVAYALTRTTTASQTTTVTGPHVSIVPGAGGASNPTGFSPDVIRVVLGVNATVTWTNDDTIDHTVTSDTGLFRSPIMSSGQLFTFTLTAPGNYTYGCEFHPLMKGTVVVLQPH